MGRSNGPLRRQHQAVYRLRRKLALSPVRKPWDYLTCAEVKAMAWQAYRVASRGLIEDAEGGRFAHSRLREMFAEALAGSFRDALFSHAVTEGGCWPVTPDTPSYRDYPAIWAAFASGVPATWNPQYRVYGGEWVGSPPLEDHPQ
jgi:hypothetical protein